MSTIVWTASLCVRWGGRDAHDDLSVGMMLGKSKRLAVVSGRDGFYGAPEDLEANFTVTGVTEFIYILGK